MKPVLMLLFRAALLTILPACAFAQQEPIELTLLLKKKGAADSSRYNVRSYSFRMESALSRGTGGVKETDLAIELGVELDTLLLQWAANAAVTMDGRLIVKNRNGKVVSEAVFRNAHLSESTEIFYAGSDVDSDYRATLLITPEELALNGIPVKK